MATVTNVMVTADHVQRDDPRCRTSFRLGAHPSLPASLAGKTISDSGLANSIIWAAVK